MKNGFKGLGFIGGLTATAAILLSVGFSLAKGPDLDALRAIRVEKHSKVCASGEGTDVGCYARVVDDEKGSPRTSTTPEGYGPAQLRGAYSLNNLSSSDTIAIVDAYDHPNIKKDLDKYNSTFGLPQFPNCSANVTTSCFQKVNQRGGTSYPQQNAGWALEIALDVEVAHGLCPSCKILLVEADSNSYTNLLAAVDRAVLMGADVVSMSWGSIEFSSETIFDSHFNVPGVVFVTSSGDNGFGAGYPAASPYVVAAGGTTLAMIGNAYAGEAAWSGSGSGCSAYEPQPAHQTSLGLSGCAKRMIADVSADADPSTGAAVYSSIRYAGRSGWFKLGGTSLSSPVISAVYALAGNGSTINPANGYPYSHTLGLNDIVSGSNGSCSVSYLCNATSGYDGPTGVGSPIGVGAF